MAENAKGIDSDLIRGHIDTIILKVLKTGDRYGYEIIKDVETKSQGTYELKQPTLYSCLKRLEGQGLISSYWTDSDIGGKRHYYKLTQKGQEDLEKNQNEWLKSRSIIDSLIYENVPASSHIAPAQQFETQVVQSPNEPAIQTEEEEILEEIQDDLEFVQSMNDSNLEEELLGTEQSAKENEEQLEMDHFALQEAEQKRILAKLESQPTPLEQISEQEPIQSAKESNDTIDDEDYEFSTFADESRRQKEMARAAEQLQNEVADSSTEEKRQHALEILYQDTLEDRIFEQENFQTNNKETKEEVQSDFESKTQQVEQTTPQIDSTQPTFEQKQTLKLFEGNKITGNFTDSTYKNKLNELSSLIVRSKPADANFAAQKTYKGVEYDPQDTNTMKRKFEAMGISVRIHQKLERVKEEKTHLFKNKIRLARAWITFGATSTLLALSLIILCTTNLVNMSAKYALPLYLPAFIILLAFPVITTIVYWCDPQKRVPARYAPRLSIISSLLFFIQALVITYAINLQTGFVSFHQSDYNHLGWIVPTIASLSIIISTITYYFLYRSKKFHS